MSIGMVRFVAALLVASFAGIAAAKPTPPTIEQLAAFPRLSSVALSPDGAHIAAVEGQGETRVIKVWRTDALSATPTVIGSTQMKIQAVSFIKNDVLAVTLWQPLDLRYDKVTLTFVTKLMFTDLAGRNWHEPLALPSPRSQVEELEQSRTSPSVLDTLVNDPNHVLLVNNVGAQAGDIFRVDVHTGLAQRVERADEDISSYVTDLTGAVRARSKIGNDGKGAYVAIQFRNAAGGWDEHFRSYARDRDVTQVVGFTKDPNIALILSNVGQDKAAVFEYDIAKRAKGENIFQHRYFEASGVAIWRHAGPDLGEVTGLVYNGPRGDDVIWTSPRFQAIDQAVRKGLGLTPQPITFVDPATGKSAAARYDSDLSYDITSYSDDLKSVVIAVEGPNTPRTYYLLKDGKLAPLAKTYPDIDAASLGKTSLIYYKARDGLDIPAFLTTPNPELCGPGPWKAVVHPHGGPWARDEMRFDYSMWVPLMASRCMAVLRPQYRGSDGWSRRLWTAGDAEWGQKMQDDKDDGARWLIENHIAQPGHIAIFGFSYGGYAAFAASVREGGPFKCAIAGAGVSDIHRIFSDFYLNPFFLQAQKSTIAGLNPLDRADKLAIPLMVYAGRRDQTVPIEQSEWFVARAKRAGQPIEFHELDDYAHGPAWTRKIFADQLHLIDDYFSKGCGGGGL